jgi:hypothetical protein
MLPRRASRPAAAFHSEKAREQVTSVPPKSQRFTSGILTAESASEHIRNAIQILAVFTARGPSPADATLVDYVDLDAIASRLTRALAQIELVPAPPVAIIAVRRMVEPTDFRRPLGVDVPHCIHCGCTDDSACLIDVDALTPNDRRDVEQYFAEQPAPLPDRVPCWWISEDPLVCSNPHCVELHRGVHRVTP